MFTHADLREETKIIPLARKLHAHLKQLDGCTNLARMLVLRKLIQHGQLFHSEEAWRDKWMAPDVCCADAATTIKRVSATTDQYSRRASKRLVAHPSDTARADCEP